MGRKFLSPPRFPAVRLLSFLAASCSFLVSCLPTGGGSGSGGAGNCAKEFEVAVKPDEIRANKVYISLNKLTFLEADGFVLNEAELEAGFDGRRRPEEDLMLDLNGIKLSRRDGGPMCDRMDHEEGRGSTGRFKLHKMYMHGGFPFELFLLHLKLQRGRLVLQMNSRGGVRIRDVSVIFKGRTYSACPQPSPGPSPAPQPKPAAVTRIDSVEPSDSPVAANHINIAFSADQTGVSFFCSLDGSAPALCASPVSYTGVANGDHTFRVYSKNAGGVVENPPQSYTWTVDTAAPEVTITNADELAGLTSSNAASFEFTSSENGAFECALDGGAFAPCQSPHSYSGLGEGPHRFAVRAVDGAGNVSASPAFFYWMIDISAPVTSIVLVEPAGGITNVDRRRFEFIASESSSFECAVDNGTFESCASPLEVTGLTDGSHSFEVRARDAAGNLGVPVGVAWKNDSVAPVVSLGAVTPAPGLTGGTAVTAEFFADEPATTYCSRDGSDAAVCASPLSWSDLADGAHTLDVFAVDLAGNASAMVRLSWQVDTTAPVLVFASIAPSPGTHVSSRDLTFTIAGGEGAELGMRLNGTPIAAANPLTLSGLADGAYTLDVSASDAAGNVSAVLSHEFIVDTAAPVFSVAALDPRDPTSSDIRVFLFSASENVVYECDVDSAGFAPCAPPFALSGLADGLHTMSVRATDPAGNAELQTVQWTVDTMAPVTALSAVQDSGTISFTFSADETASFTCVLDGGPGTNCSSPLSYSGLSPGEHTFRVYATDVAGNTEAGGAVYVWTVVAPITTSITGQSPPPGSLSGQTTASFSFAASQTASGFLCSLDGAPAVACSSPVTYDGLSDGNHVFTVRAVDAWGSADPTGATTAWTVDTTSPAVINLAATATTNTITVTWATSEAATDKVLYGVGFTVTSQTTESSTYVTTHSVKIVGLTSNTTYTIQVFGRDQAGNAYLSATRTIRTSR